MAKSIALYLFVLALVALIPGFIFSAILLQRNNEAQERVVETLVTGTSRSILQAVERELAGNVTTLRVLATAPSLLERDYRSFYDRVKLALGGTQTYIYLLDPDLMSLMSTRTEYGAPSRRSNDPKSGQLALATNSVVISDAVFGSVSQEWVFNILLPVTLPQGEKVILGLSRSTGDLSGALLSNKLPEGWNVALVDAAGTVIAASSGAGSPGEHLDVADLAPSVGSAGWVEVKTPEAEYLAVLQHSTLARWTIIAWAPRALITQPLANAFWSLFVGGILLTAVVVLIIYWVSLQIGRSVRGLENDARLVGAGEAVPARDYPISEISTVSESLAEASRRRKAAEHEVRLLMRELAHRSKNQLAVIAAMAKQSAKSGGSVSQFVANFERRIHGLARSTDLLLAHGMGGVELKEVLSRQVEPLCPRDSGRITLAGPPFRLGTQAAQILGMAAHELATNAVRYGAFACDTGRIDISWSVVGDRLELRWLETNTPVKRSRRRGFGTTVLENMVGRSLGAVVERSLNEDGISWTFSIPLESLRMEAEAPALSVTPGDVPAAPEK